MTPACTIENREQLPFPERINAGVPQGWAVDIQNDFSYETQKNWKYFPLQNQSCPIGLLLPAKQNRRSEIGWMSDNGPDYTADNKRRFAMDIGLKPLTTPMCSPQSNGTV